MWRGLCTSVCCGQILLISVAVVMDVMHSLWVDAHQRGRGHVCAGTVCGGLHISVDVVMDVLAQYVWGLTLHISMAVVMDVLHSVWVDAHQRGRGHGCAGTVWGGLCTSAWPWSWMCWHSVGGTLHISVAVVMDVLAQCGGDSAHQRGRGHGCAGTVWGGLCTSAWPWSWMCWHSVGGTLHISVAVVMDVLAQCGGDSAHQRGRGHGCAGTVWGGLCTSAWPWSWMCWHSVGGTLHISVAVVMDVLAQCVGGCTSAWPWSWKCWQHQAMYLSVLVTPTSL
ncbi:hypothetical protein MDA_GLEAN10013854 [Myotis davidii]|uniref:Uncharacterized protein n=1 Tax=Myotis davidii TaxID=225400 RepID=L5LPZ3_MYODS|nr:hypothetical protein MDA_GLEAN10013854 [Myotis davidii]